MRLRVEIKRKGCPDRQTAACLGGVSFEVLAVQHPRATLWPSPPQGGARFSGTIPCFPLRGNAALAAKGCTRLRVEMKRKGCPDRQTAACLGGVSFEVLAVQHPRATTWPSPPQGGARFSALRSCRLQWSTGKRDHLLFPLEGKCRGAAKGCPRLRVEMERKGCPDRQTAACLGGCHLRFLPYSTPAPLRGPLPLKGAQGSAVLCTLAVSRGARFSVLS